MALFKVLCQYCLPTDGVWTGELPIRKLTEEITCDTQSKRTRKMDGAHDRPSTEGMLPMAKLPTMTGRVHILQAQFLYRSLHVLEDTLLRRPHVQHTRGYSLPRTVDDNECLSKNDPPVSSGPTQRTDLLQRLLQRIADLNYFSTVVHDRD
ncbi:hypothetical protein G6F37_006337 [Rhizopus arrhizus]|nr:hypothetical protein G6F37_006337 [Rhizopus arrhizus]